MAQNQMVLNYIGETTTADVSPSVPIGSMAVFTDALSGEHIKIYDGTTWIPMQTVNYNVSDKMKELISENLKFGSMWFYKVEAIGYDWDELHTWCSDTFGPPRTGPDTYNKHKWFISGGDFFFHEEKYRDWFILKWSSSENSQTLAP